MRWRACRLKLYRADVTKREPVAAIVFALIQRAAAGEAQIQCGGRRAIVDELGLRLAMPPAARRFVRDALPRLCKDGGIVLHDSGLTIVNHEERQERSGIDDDYRFQLVDSSREESRVSPMALGLLDVITAAALNLDGELDLARPAGVTLTEALLRNLACFAPPKHHMPYLEQWFLELTAAPPPVERRKLGRVGPAEPPLLADPEVEDLWRLRDWDRQPVRAAIEKYRNLPEVCEEQSAESPREPGGRAAPSVEISRQGIQNESGAKGAEELKSQPMDAADLADCWEALFSRTTNYRDESRWLTEKHKPAKPAESFETQTADLDRDPDGDPEASDAAPLQPRTTGARADRAPEHSTHGLPARIPELADDPAPVAAWPLGGAPGQVTWGASAHAHARLVTRGSKDSTMGENVGEVVVCLPVLRREPGGSLRLDRDGFPVRRGFVEALERRWPTVDIERALNEMRNLLAAPGEGRPWRGIRTYIERYCRNEARVHRGFKAPPGGARLDGSEAGAAPPSALPSVPAARAASARADRRGVRAAPPPRVADDPEAELKEELWRFTRDRASWARPLPTGYPDGVVAEVLIAWAREKLEALEARGRELPAWWNEWEAANPERWAEAKRFERFMSEIALGRGRLVSGEEIETDVSIERVAVDGRELVAK